MKKVKLLAKIKLAHGGRKLRVASINDQLKRLPTLVTDANLVAYMR